MSIELKPSEISSVDSIGNLDGEDVKLVRTLGGLYVAVGKPRGKNKEEVLSAGSHPAIVRFNIEKSFKGFQPSLMKSEAGMEPMVATMSHLLPSDMFKGSYDIYVVKNNLDFEVMLTKNHIEVINYKASVSGDDLVVQKPGSLVTNDLVPALPALSKALAWIAIDEDKTSLVTNNKKYDPKKIVTKK